METNRVEEFWTKMSHEDRVNLLKSKNLWDGANTYLWEYLPEQIKTAIEEEFQKSRR
jgi:hypothetical protein